MRAATTGRIRTPGAPWLRNGNDFVRACRMFAVEAGVISP
jgi:hypothetical protein